MFELEKLSEKILDSIVFEPMTGCWLWIGARQDPGYGRLHDPKTNKLKYAHRYVREELDGPIPDGLVTDHLCRTEPCVSPYHTEPVTNQENIRRGASGEVARARAARIVQCPVGHLYDEANTYVRKETGHRNCKRVSPRSDASVAIAKRSLKEWHSIQSGKVNRWQTGWRPLSATPTA